MAEPRRLELKSVHPERKLAIHERSTSRPEDRYAIRIYGGPALERLEVFSEAAMLQLVNFVDPTDGRMAEYRQEIDRLHRQIGVLQREVGGLHREREEIRDDVATLVKTLTDAWWLHAAAAYGNLKTWLEEWQ